MMFALLLAAELTKLPQLLEAPPAVYPPDRLARGGAFYRFEHVSYRSPDIVKRQLLHFDVALDHLDANTLDGAYGQKLDELIFALLIALLLHAGSTGV